MEQKLYDYGIKWHYLQIPLTDKCNLLCKHCMRTEKFLGRDISFDVFKKYLSNFHPGMCDTLLLSDFGEPFLRRDLLGILRYVKSQGFSKVEVVSNGTLFDKHDFQAIIKEGLLRRIRISTEAASKEMFEKIRGGDYGLFLSNLKMVIKYKAELNSQYPSLILNVVCLKENLHELPRIMDLAHDYKIDFVCFVHLNSITMDILNEPQNDFLEKLCVSSQHLDNCDHELKKRIFQIIDEKSRKYSVNYLPPEDYFAVKETNGVLKSGKSKCNMPYQWVQIGLDGSVFPCCQISKKITVGNLNDNSFEQIWSNKKFEGFRKDLEEGVANDWCKICNIFKGKRF